MIPKPTLDKVHVAILKQNPKSLFSKKYCCQKPTCEVSLTPPYSKESLVCATCGSDCRFCRNPKV